MADEYEETVETEETYDSSETVFSSFVPLLVLLIGLLIWIGYQDFAENVKRGFFKSQIDQISPVYDVARKWQARYESMLQDLNSISTKDPAAAAILKDAVQAGVQAGLIRFTPQTQPQTPAAPAESPTGSTTPAPAQ